MRNLRSDIQLKINIEYYIILIVFLINLWSKYVKKCHTPMNKGWKINTSGTSRLMLSILI